MREDSIMREALRIKYEIAAKYGYDVRALGKALQEKQRGSGAKYVNRRPKQAKVK
jgi:hypothetical protein